MKSSLSYLIPKLEGQKVKNAYLVTFLNQFSYLFFRTKHSLFRDFNTIYIDGIGLVYLLRIFGFKTERRSFDMTSLAPKVFQDCIVSSKSIYFIGSTEEAICSFVKVILNVFPNLRIIGYRNGFFSNDYMRETVLKEILGLNPGVLIVGMGTPYQEQFLVDLKKLGWNGEGYTCGGFIHQTAKGIKYYPKFYDDYNLRWLYRIIDEPRLFKRYFYYYPLSICLFTFDLISYKWNKIKM